MGTPGIQNHSVHCVYIENECTLGIQSQCTPVVHNHSVHQVYSITVYYSVMYSDGGPALVLTLCLLKVHL